MFFGEDDYTAGALADGPLQTGSDWPTAPIIDITGAKPQMPPAPQPIGKDQYGNPVWIPSFVIGKTAAGEPIYSGQAPAGKTDYTLWIVGGVAALLLAAVALGGKR